MVLISFLHKLLYTFTSIDRYWAFDHRGKEPNMFIDTIGIIFIQQGNGFSN